MADNYRIIGAEMSPYSVKVRSYFRYKAIPHQWVLRNAASVPGSLIGSKLTTTSDPPAAIEVPCGNSKSTAPRRCQTLLGFAVS